MRCTIPLFRIDVHPLLDPWQSCILNLMFAIIWEFDVRPEFWNIYREEYSSNGIWAQLFRQANGYRGTTLLIDESTPHRAVTIDRWEREEDFDEFKKVFADEYHTLDKRCEQYTLGERLIGRFKEAI